jgi:MFS family permease
MNLRDHVRAAAGGLPRTFWVLCAGMLVNRAGSFVLPFLAVYLTRVRGYSAASAGVVAACYGAGGILASLIGGYFADHAGRRITMLGALTLGGLGMMSLALVRDIRLIAPAVFVVAMAGEAYRPAMLAAVGGLVPSAERVRALGILYWVINIGFSIGATLGGALATVSYSLLFVGDGLTSLLFAALIARAVPETRPLASHGAGHTPRSPVREFVAPFMDVPFALFILLSVCIMLVFMQHITALPIDIGARGISAASLGAVLAVNGIAIVILQPLVAPALQRRNRSRMLAIGGVLIGAGFGLNALAHGAALFALGVLIWSIGEIFVLPIGNAVVADVAPSHMRGRYQGAYGLSFGLAGLCAPLIGTWTMQRLGAPALWLACLAMGLAVAIGHLLLAPRLTRLRQERLSARAGEEPAAASG